MKKRTSKPERGYSAILRRLANPRLVCVTLNIAFELPLIVFQDNEIENGVSRASSVSAREKPGVSKRGKTGKQRRDDSDSFDSRHNYTPYWGPQQQTWVPQPQYVPVSNQYGAPVQQPYPNQIPAAPYNTTPTQTFAPMMPNAGYNAGYPNMTPVSKPFRPQLQKADRN